MRYGAILPGGTATQQLGLACLAEEVGWDGVFVWEAAYGVDPWSLLAAIAVQTTHVQLGTLLTPLPWRRPWKVASQVMTLDQLSGGRAILAVGLGALTTELPLTGEVLDRGARAEMLDEGIDLIRHLWNGGRHFHGTHYSYETPRDDLAEMAKPVRDRIPIWVVGAWPRPKSMRRVLRCDGVIPEWHLGDGHEGREGTPDDARELRVWLADHDAGESFDLVAEGETPDDNPVQATAIVTAWADAGCTWWLESRWELPHHSEQRMAQMRRRLAAGPPQLPSA